VATGTTLNLALFYFFAILAVLSAIFVVTTRNVVHSAIFLITALLATAGIYLQLQAEFLFIVQIILYVGGIMVLFIFVIMLVNLDVAVRQEQFNRQWLVGSVLALALGAQLLFAFWLVRHQGGILSRAPAATAALQPNTELIAQGLFRDYVLPFEIASILLLVAMIGAVVMAKRRI
jgi:NADH-quinone oxidoreductase subunit J